MERDDERQSYPLFRPQLLKAAKIKAAHAEHSLSYLVNEALRMFLEEDALDTEAAEKRAKEPVRRLSAVLKDMKRDGLLKGQGNHLRATK